MANNLLKEYKDRLKKLRDICGEDIKEDDLNACLTVHPRLEKQIFDMGLILDLAASAAEEEAAAERGDKPMPHRPMMPFMMAYMAEKSYPRASSWLRGMLNYSDARKQKEEKESIEGGENNG